MNKVKFSEKLIGKTTEEDLDIIRKNIAEMDNQLNEKLLKEGFVRDPINLTAEEIYKIIYGRDYENPQLRNIGWVVDRDKLEDFKLNFEMTTALNEEKEPVIMLNFKEEPDWLK